MVYVTVAWREFNGRGEQVRRTKDVPKPKVEAFWAKLDGTGNLVPDSFTVSRDEAVR